MPSIDRDDAGSASAEGFIQDDESRALLTAGQPQIEVQQILQTAQSWDSANYRSYPAGLPQLTVLRIKVPLNNDE